MMLSGWLALAVVAGCSRPAEVASGRPPLTKTEKELVAATELYKPKPKEAKAAFEGFVAEHAKSPDKKVQDQVTNARMKLGYLTSRTKDFPAARKQFLVAAKEHMGTDSMSADFGGLEDQAAYQAVVCLDGEGKREQAVKEFKRFIHDYPLSPLAHAAFKRLRRLNAADAEAEALLQQAVKKQEVRTRFETSVCGPKAIEYLLPLLGKPAKSYKEIAKLCGTTDKGTTIEGLKAGLRACGVKAFPFELNRKDFQVLKGPAIWLVDDHYVVLLRIEGNKAFVYDPRYRSESALPLPELDSTDFSATVITFEIPSTLGAQP